MFSGDKVRRSERLPFPVPIVICGKDADGRSFTEDCWTILISRHGGLIATCHKLASGGQLQIENPSLSRTATAKVVCINEGKPPDTLFEVGVEVDGADYLWPVEFARSEGTGSPPVAAGSPQDRDRKKVA